jgi:hypothetical protein
MSTEIIAGNDLMAAISNGVFELVEETFTPEASDSFGNSPAAIIASYIIAQALASSPVTIQDWPIFISSMPDGYEVKSDCVAIYDTPGELQGRLMIGRVIQRYGIQIKVRAIDAQEGFAKAEAVAVCLDSLRNEDIGVGEDTFRIRNASRTTPVTPLGAEEGTKRRFLFTVNFLISLMKITEE